MTTMTDDTDDPYTDPPGLLLLGNPFFLILVSLGIGAVLMLMFMSCIICWRRRCEATGRCCCCGPCKRPRCGGCCSRKKKFQEFDADYMSQVDIVRKDSESFMRKDPRSLHEPLADPTIEEL